MDFDLRLLVVLLPIILAGSWAVYNIGQAAIRQIQGFLDKQA
ncbi:MAG: photosystem II protein Y [Elainellaceae cyanobacterium]